MHKCLALAAIVMLISAALPSSAQEAEADLGDQSDVSALEDDIRECSKIVDLLEQLDCENAAKTAQRERNQAENAALDADLERQQAENAAKAAQRERNQAEIARQQEENEELEAELEQLINELKGKASARDD